MSSADPTATADVVEFAIPADEIDRYFEWTSCAAFRFVRDGDTVRFQVALTDDTRDRYRAALVQIADSEGPWGWIAHAALHPERAERGNRDAS